MKVQQVFTKRGKSLIAATGIAAVVMFNGLGGGIAGANQAPPAVCEFAPSIQSDAGVATGSSDNGGTTASLPAGNGATAAIQDGGKPAETGTSTEATAGSSGAATANTQSVPDATLDVAQACGVESAAAGQTVSVDVCVSGSDLSVTNLSPTTEFVPSVGGEAVPGAGAGANSSAGQIDPNAPQTVPGAGAQAGTVDAGSLEITQAEGGVVTSIEDAPGVSIIEGEVSDSAVASTGSTCVSVTVTDGSTSIDITTGAGAAAQSGGANAPGAGQPATGEVVPTQPGVTNGAPTQPGTQTTPQLDPNATPPAPGQ